MKQTYLGHSPHHAATTPETIVAVARSIYDGAARLVDTVLVWQERYQDRRRLEAMSDYLLRDMGINRYDAMLESAKPFWRA